MNTEMGYIAEIKRRLQGMIRNNDMYQQGYKWALEMVDIVIASDRPSQDGWTEPCNQCGGFRGHERWCTGSKPSAAPDRSSDDQKDAARYRFACEHGYIVFPKAHQQYSCVGKDEADWKIDHLMTLDHPSHAMSQTCAKTKPNEGRDSAGNELKA
jgi:hypothetical protein